MVSLTVLCVAHMSQEQQSTSSPRTMVADDALPLNHPLVPHAARENMCAHMPSARTLALTACSGLPLAVLRASPTDLMCARVRPLAGLSWVLHSSRAPPRFKCKRTAINSLRCAQALRWCARPLSPVRAHVPLERLTIGPRVRPPIAATSSRPSRAWRSSEDRAAKLTTLLWVALVAWGQAAIVSVSDQAVQAARACRGDVRARRRSPWRSRRRPKASVCAASMLPQHTLGLGRSDAGQ